MRVNSVDNNEFQLLMPFASTIHRTLLLIWVEFVMYGRLKVQIPHSREIHFVWKVRVSNSIFLKI